MNCQMLPSGDECPRARVKASTVISAAGAPGPAFSGSNSVLHFLQGGGDVHLQVQAAGNGFIAFTDLCKFIGKRFSVVFQGMAEIEEVGDLLIAGKTFTGGAGYQITAGRLQLQNAADFPELFRVGQRTSAEFGYDTFKHGIPSIMFRVRCSAKHQPI